MPPQIKHDLNRSGWETTDFPSVCETCLPDNPYVQMLKEDYGAECKICSRPFTVFRWKADRTARQKRTDICLTCARLKNCCQSCMLDLSFGLSIPVRDAALKMIAPGPKGDVNKQWYAQEHEKSIEEGKAGIDEAYQQTEAKARELLGKLARSEPYRRKDAEDNGRQLALPAPGGSGSGGGVGPIRTRDTRGPMRGDAKMGKRKLQPISPADYIPPNDPNIVSLFITGVEDDLPEFEIRAFFAQYGALRSVVVSHRAHGGYINFETRVAAERAAAACQGKAVIAGCPIRIRWGKPKKLDSMGDDERMTNLKEGRAAHGVSRITKKALANTTAAGGKEEKAEGFDNLLAQAPPGADDVNYASLQGN